MTKFSDNNQSFFLFAFYVQMTHDNVNNFQLVDEPLAKFFDSFKSMLHNTLLVFAGDHGPRYGPSVPSAYGRMEERLPLVTIRVPDPLIKKYPHLEKFLAANKR